MYCLLTPCQHAHTRWTKAGKYRRTSQSQLKPWGLVNLFPVEASIKHSLFALCWHSSCLEKITTIPSQSSPFSILNLPKGLERFLLTSPCFIFALGLLKRAQCDNNYPPRWLSFIWDHHFKHNWPENASMLLFSSNSCVVESAASETKLCTAAGLNSTRVQFVTHPCCIIVFWKEKIHQTMGEWTVYSNNTLTMLFELFHALNS